jgi:hypothetical protein
MLGLKIDSCNDKQSLQNKCAYAFAVHPGATTVSDFAAAAAAAAGASSCDRHRDCQEPCVPCRLLSAHKTPAVPGGLR